MNRTIRWIALGVALLLPTSLSHGQTLLGSDGLNMAAWEFTPMTGGPCPEPLPLLAGCPYTVPFCGLVGPGPAQPGTFFGDIADDPLTDTFYLTDGFVIEQYTLDTPCFGPMTCAPLNAFGAPTLLGPLTGMGFDHTGGVVSALGSRLLWLTDGLRIMAIRPGIPGSCSFTTVFGPCTPPIPGGGRMTDITWDPTTGTLWVCDTLGQVHNIAVPGCTILSSFPAVGACGLSPDLTGIAYDGGTSPAAPLPFALPALWITDGNTVARLDISGAPAAPTFGAPISCFPSANFLNGLALTQHGFQFGQNRVQARLDTYGQASTPGPTFGLEVFAAPFGANAWMILNYNFPGPGFFCPSVPAASTQLWVSPVAPGTITFLGPLPPNCAPIPAAIPPGVPIGLEAYVQIIFTAGASPPAIDATNAIAVTFMLP